MSDQIDIHHELSFYPTRKNDFLILYVQTDDGTTKTYHSRDQIRDLVRKLNAWCDTGEINE